MNDDQLIAALRGLDRQVLPDSAFAARLFGDLERRAAPRPTPRVHLILVTALLAIAALAAVLVVGSGSSQPRRVLTDAATPAPPPSTRPYLVEVPEGVTPASSPEEVEGELGRSGMLAPPSAGVIRSMSWHRGGMVPIFSGSMESDAPVWVVTVITTDNRRLVVLIEDGTLASAGSALEAEPPTSGPPSVDPVIPLATRDPAKPLQLIGSDGRTITPHLVAAPNADSLPGFGEGVTAGDVIWLLARHDLYRIDARKKEISIVDLPDGQWTSIDRGRDAVWVSGSGGKLAVDPVSGDVVRSLTVEGSLLGEDAEGLWLAHARGIELIDEETGRRIRRIETTETADSVAYIGLNQMPAYGSLWDMDRGTGDIHRIDPVSGEIVATIPIGATEEHCGSFDPAPLRGVEGLPDVLSACNGTVLIDPVTNEVIRRFTEPRHGFVMNGGWWSGEFVRNGEGWQTPGSLIRFDPAGGPPLERLQLNYERTVVSPVGIAGDALWVTIGERGGENKSFSRNRVLAWIPLSELTD